MSMPSRPDNPAKRGFQTGAYRNGDPVPRKLPILILCGMAALACSGCMRRTVHAAPNLRAAASASHPRFPAKRSNPTDANLDPPELIIAAPEPVTLPVSRMVPPRPRAGIGAAQPAEAEAVDPRPAPPQLSPTMSPQEQASAERQTNQSIGTAEHNLQAALGRQLTATQADLVEKIRGFLGQAREAIRDHDWLRARTLAQKAQVLSTELVNSLSSPGR
jgi:hypothetical protein